MFNKARLPIILFIVINFCSCNRLQNQDKPLSIKNLLNTFRSPASGDLEAKPAYLGNDTIDVLNYTVNAKIAEMPPKQIEFQTEIKLITLTESENIKLHIESSTTKINSVLVNGVATEFNILPGQKIERAGPPVDLLLSGDILSIHLKNNSKAQQSVVLTLNYTIKKEDWSAKTRGIYYHPKKEDFDIDVLTTRSWPYFARFWLPSNDSPNDVAPISMNLTVPEGFTAIANGKLVNEQKVAGSTKDSPGYHIFKWEQKEATTTYNYVFSVGQFDVIKEDICFNNDNEINNKRVDCNKADNKIPLELYYNKNHPDAEKIVYQVHKASDSAIYFSKLFGKFIFDKLAFVHIPSYPFSMESTSLIVLSFPQASVHEVVHHWWGDNVHIKNWGDFWISEGFTTYFTGVYDEYLTGTNTANLDLKGDRPLNHSEMTDPMAIFDDTAYSKGAASVHALRRTIVHISEENQIKNVNPKNSTKVFFKLIQLLYSNYSKKELSTPAFIEFVKANIKDVLKSEHIEVSDKVIQENLDKWVTDFYKTY